MTSVRSTKIDSGDSESNARLNDLLARFSGISVAVVGDVIADEFIYGRVARMSREAPVLILDYDETTITPGGAGNAAVNVDSLGGKTRLVGLVGRGDVDRRLVTSLGIRINKSCLIRPRGYRAPVKTRILAGGLHSARQQVVRIDRDTSTAIESDTRREFERVALGEMAVCDAVLVSDYGSGLVTPALVSRMRNVLSRRGYSVPILVDSRYNLLAYQGCTAYTPNESEIEQVLGISIGEDPKSLERAGRTVLKRTRAQGLIVTRGSRGMSVFVPRRRTQHIPIFGNDEVADVTGAGDTVIATMTLAIAAGASFSEAAQLANYAGGVVVTKRGTASVHLEELRQAVSSEGGSDA